MKKPSVVGLMVFALAASVAAQSSTAPSADTVGIESI